MPLVDDPSLQSPCSVRPGAQAGANDTVYAALLVLCVRQGIPERAMDVWDAIREVSVLTIEHTWHQAPSANFQNWRWLFVAEMESGG